jgi:hypothetical protein
MGQSRGRDRDSGGLRVLRPRRRPSGGRSTVPLLGSRGDHDGSELDVVIRPDSPQAAARRAAAGRPDAAVGPPAELADGCGVGTSPASVAGAGGPVATRGELGGSAGAAPRGAAGSRDGAATGGDAAPRSDRERPEQAPVAPRAGSAARRAAAIRRARVLAVLLLLALVSWLAAAVSWFPLAIPMVVTALLVADVMVLRAVARRRQARRHEQTLATHPVGHGKDTPSSTAGGEAGAGRDLPAERTTATGVRRPAARTSWAPLRRTLPPTAAARRPASHRVARREAPAAEAGLPTSDGTWMPVPVPPPTYTLKPMAPRPEPPVLESDDSHPTGPTGPTGPGGAAGGAPATGAGGAGAVAPGSDRTPPLPPNGPVPDRYEGVEPPAAQERPTRRPWEEDREWADELDLDAVLARRRAVNG